VKDILFQ